MPDVQTQEPSLSGQSFAAGGPNFGATCVICMESLAASVELARPAACQHRFCRPCLERLCQENRHDARCPLDRQPFSRYGVSRRGAVGESMHEVETLQPLRRLFGSLVEPLTLGIVLLLMLWLKPSYTLALHIVATGAIYWYTSGACEWKHYIAYAAVFYLILLPVMHIGLLEVMYSWFSGCLIVRWVGQLPELRSNELTPEKLLFIATVALLLLVSPAVMFSAYNLLLTYGYALCLLLSFALMNILNIRHGNRFASLSLVFFSMFHAPYLCQLAEISLSHMAYSCAALLYLTVWNTPENVQARAHLPEPNSVTKFACCIALPLLFGMSLWNALYSIVCTIFQANAKNFLASDRGKLLMKRVPLMLFVFGTMINIVLPWKLFGLWSTIVCEFAVACTSTLSSDLVQRLTASQAGVVVMVGFQFVVLGVVLPALLFCYIL